MKAFVCDAHVVRWLAPAYGGQHALGRDLIRCGEHLYGDCGLWKTMRECNMIPKCAAVLVRRCSIASAVYILQIMCPVLVVVLCSFCAVLAGISRAGPSGFVLHH